MILAGRPFLESYDPGRESFWLVLPELYAAMVKASPQKRTYANGGACAMENLLAVYRDGETILAVRSGDIVCVPTKDHERQYALDLLCNAIAALSGLIPPYSTVAIEPLIGRTSLGVEDFEDCRAFARYEPPERGRAG